MKKPNFEFKDTFMQIMSQEAKKQNERLNIKGCKTRGGQSNFKFLPKDFYV